MNPTDEQIKKFFEWCGFKYKELKWLDEAHTRFEQDGWVYPDGTMGCSPETLFHLPTLDLDNIFKYAVPKLGEKYEDLIIQFGFAKGKTRGCVIATYKGKKWPELSNTSDADPALALFWAIYKVFGEGNE